MNLERDDFIDPRVRNVIVLDDMAAEASKDQRVTDLFTEGSHHRNLSVIAITQNLYFDKNPTKRRNSSYIVVFNSPVDKQPIATLARQMYPTNPKELIRYFDDAVSRPYGYLLLDLKPTTKESMRMRTDVFKSINSNEHCTNPHSAEDIPPVRTYPTDNTHTDNTNPDNTQETCQQETDIKKITQQFPKMPSCDDCGVVIENVHDLQNHVKKWCPALKREIDEDSPSKRQRLTERTTDIFEPENGEDEGGENSREHEVYELFASLAKEHYDEAWQIKVDKYRKGGLNINKAKEKASLKMRAFELDDFIHRYGQYISQMMKLRGGVLHAEIMDSIDNYIARGMDQDRAIRMALRKHSPQFGEYLDEDEISDVSEKETDDKSDEMETDDESGEMETDDESEEETDSE